METAVINYRVTDFLKHHPPFSSIDDADLLDLAARGRVRFYEPNEYILWQGEPHRLQVFVIQQGTVSLWDETEDVARLRDVRGAGDMLGIERYNGAASCLCSARSESDVVIYAFPQSEFDAYVMKHPFAARYVAAEGRVTADYQPTGARRDPHDTFLHAVTSGRSATTCGLDASVAAVARRMQETHADAVVVVDAERRPRGVVTADSLLRWMAAGGGDASQPVDQLVLDPPLAISPEASVTDGVLAMETTGVSALVMTTNGTASGGLQALVTSRDLAPVFGEQPSALLRGVNNAASLRELRTLNQRARAFLLDYLTSAASVDWLARLAFLVDVAIIQRLVTLAGLEGTPGCWCVSGAAGRGESLTGTAPQLLLMTENDAAQAAAWRGYQRVQAGLADCGFLPETDLAYDERFYVATVGEWRERYRAWIRDPVRQQMYLARTLFDLRAIHGSTDLWREIEAAVSAEADGDFVHVLANDCLGNLPPLTFYQDAVVDREGERQTTFQLEQSALRPLVDVGRVFGMAAGRVLGRSTRDRLISARTLLPEHEAIFREASETLSVVLWQQGRVGISEGTTGAELPPALLSRHDRQMLKGGFRAILRLIEFTGDRSWIGRI